MRVGVVGCGSIGRRHIANLLALGCEVYGFDVSDTACERAKHASPAVRVGDGWDGLMVETARYGFDAVVIATPHDQHLEDVEDAAAMSLPFFVEKPLGTLAQLPQWRALAAGPLPVHQVGYMLRFHARAQVMHAMPLPVEGLLICDCDARTWPGATYGPMLLECSHELDLALHLGAQATVTSCVADDHQANITLGAWCVSLAWRSAAYYRHWVIGNIRTLSTATFRSPDDLGTAMYRDELAHFLRSVETGRQQAPACTLTEAVRVLDVIAQAERMAACPA